MKINLPAPKMLTSITLGLTLTLAAIGQFWFSQGNTGLLWLVLLAFLIHAFHSIRELVVKHLRLDAGDMTRLDELVTVVNELQGQVLNLKAGKVWQKGL